MVSQFIQTWHGCLPWAFPPAEKSWGHFKNVQKLRPYSTKHVRDGQKAPSEGMREKVLHFLELSGPVLKTESTNELQIRSSTFKSKYIGAWGAGNIYFVSHHIISKYHSHLTLLGHFAVWPCLPIANTAEHFHMLHCR